METIIVFIDDADYAIKLLEPMLPQQPDTPTRWVLVGCAPRVTRHISKFVTQSARAGWRGTWADKVFAQVTPQLQNQTRPHDSVITQVAPPRQSLCDLTSELTRQYNARHVLDARRPKLGQDLAPITPTQKQESNRATGYAAAFAGAGLLVGFD
jgi:hypothetical protein